MADVSTELDVYLRHRSLELLLDGARWTVATFGHLFVACLLVWALSGAVGLAQSIFWATCLSAVIVFQSVYAARWPQERLASLDEPGVQSRLRVFTVSAWLVGGCWAAAAFVLFPQGQRELQLFLVFVMGGMSLSAVGTQHVYLPACFGSMGFAIPVLALRYAMEGRWIEPVLLILYTLVIVRLARVLSQFSLRAIRLQHERDLLLAELTERARDLEAARQDAEDANLAKSRFLAQASHDLRQPLHAIGLFVESLSRDHVSEKVAHVVDRVRDSLGMLSHLFDSLLDISVLDTGHTRVNPVTFRLQEVFQQLEKEFVPIARENGVSVRFVSTSAVVQTDPVLFRRLLQNLVSNAIRYAPGGRVAIGARRRCAEANNERLIHNPSSWSVEVVDNGPGIPLADQQRIFLEFVKLKGTGSGGLGLGLAIVNRLTRLLDLAVRLSSEPGRGTRITINRLLPGTNPPVTLLDSERREDTDRLADTRIMIVDDDPEVLAATQALLSKWGCEVTAHRSFPDRWPTVDVVLSDFELETQNGLERLTQLMSESPDVRGVLVTGNSSPELREAAAKANITLLHKPVRPVKLRSLLLYLLVQDA